ncbi:MAG: ABC transporter ATP-binding protein [Candidatus Micrarchaeaceae archaeon]
MEQRLVCRNVTKKYDAGSTALDSVSLSIPLKGIFALIGRNGAGKTTLTRILATQLMPSSGSAEISGIDVVAKAGRIRELIAALPQEARAVQWLTPKQSVMSYLLYRGMGLGSANLTAEKALASLGLKQYSNKLNRLLSGGMKRKVLIAMVLASGCKILFVDEPTTGLDPLSRSELWDALSRLKKTHFIFLTTHYLEEAERLADTIGILDKGKLIASGTMDELRKSVRYQYSIMILQKGVRMEPRHGSIVNVENGFKQIITTEEEAERIGKALIRDGIRFSMNPISLEDIFYYYVKKPIESEKEQEEWQQ